MPSNIASIHISLSAEDMYCGECGYYLLDEDSTEDDTDLYDICPNCGKIIDIDSDFCSECGFDLSDQDEADEVNDDHETKQDFGYYNSVSDFEIIKWNDNKFKKSIYDYFKKDSYSDLSTLYPYNFDNYFHMCIDMRGVHLTSKKLCWIPTMWTKH